MNAFERINELIAHMSDPDFPSTIDNLAKTIGVSPVQVEKDLTYLREYRTQASDSKPLFGNAITESDDTPAQYHINRNIFTTVTASGNNKKKLLSLSHSEYLLYESINALIREDEVTNNLSSKYADVYVQKSTDDSPSQYSAEDILVINNAINNGLCVSIDNYLISPHFIRRDMNTRLLYVVEVFPDDCNIASYPLVNDDDSEMYVISSNEPVEVRRSELSQDIIDRVGSIWSFESEYETEINSIDSCDIPMPVKVRVKIYDGTGNIIAKLKKDILQRSRATLTGPFVDCKDGLPESLADVNMAEENDYFIYEDYVLGLSAFKRYLLRFGRSAIVLEPKELAIEIYNDISDFA